MCPYMWWICRTPSIPQCINLRVPLHVMRDIHNTWSASYLVTTNFRTLFRYMYISLYHRHSILFHVVPPSLVIIYVLNIIFRRHCLCGVVLFRRRITPFFQLLALWSGNNPGHSVLPTWMVPSAPIAGHSTVNLYAHGTTRRTLSTSSLPRLHHNGNHSLWKCHICISRLRINGRDIRRQPYFLSLDWEPVHTVIFAWYGEIRSLSRQDWMDNSILSNNYHH